MIKTTRHTLSINQISLISQTDFMRNLANSSDDYKIKAGINQPSGNFFYDPWTIKIEFQNTIFEEILHSLPNPIGEARFVILKPGSCYHSHADIDDRYHLNIQGQYSHLIDLDNHKMFPTEVDGQWYTMNAGHRHVAANFGSIDRIQLVVRQLLKRNQLSDFVSVNVFYVGVDYTKARFIFDDKISPWLNYACKNNIIDDFKTDQKQIWFNIDRSEIQTLKIILGSDFNIEVVL